MSTLASAPFSNRVTVVGETPAFRAKSRTPQPSAVRAMRTCNRVIIRPPKSHLTEGANIGTLLQYTNTV